MPSQGLLGCQGPVLVHNFHCLESPAQVQQGSGNLGWVRVEQASRATCTAGVPQRRSKLAMNFHKVAANASSVTKASGLKVPLN